MRAAVVVPVFEAGPLLEPCLEALLATSRVRVLVVDDCSGDDSLARARVFKSESGGRVDVLALERNVGFAGAVNRGVAALLASAQPPDVIVLVNQDCVVSPGWLEPLLETLADPSVAAAGARLLDADGVTLQHAGARIEANGLTSHPGRGSRDPRAFRESTSPDYVCGALFALRSETWKRVGAFDEGYFPAYFEEVDWCLRARREGLRIVYVPASEARHAEASTSRAGSDVFLARYHRSRLRFVARHLLPRGVWRWARAELGWLRTLRRTGEIRPVLAAYARFPAFVAEQRRERRR